MCSYRSFLPVFQILSLFRYLQQCHRHSLTLNWTRSALQSFSASNRRSIELGARNSCSNSKESSHPHYLILKSFLSNRFFQSRHESSFSPYFPANAGVPQGSVLFLNLHIICTSDVPTHHSTIPFTSTSTPSRTGSVDGESRLTPKRAPRSTLVYGEFHAPLSPWTRPLFLHPTRFTT